MADSEVTITREFDAPPQKVWDAWTQPELLMKWWGPKDFTCPEANVDLKVGGKNLVSMRTANGEDVWSTGEYLEIDPPHKLVITDNFADSGGNIVSGAHYGMDDMPLSLKMVITVVFEELSGGRTKMTLTHSGLPSTQSRDATTGWTESLDKLAELVN